MKNFYLSAALCWFCLFVSLLLKAQAPTQPAVNLHFSNVEGHSFSVNYTRGNGSSRLVIARKGQPVTSIPQNGKDYNHNLVFGKGEELNEGEFVVYDGTIAGFGLSGLTPNTEYHFAVFEYNGSGFGTQYLTQSFLNGQGSTLAPPAVQVSGLTASQLNGNSALLSWVNGSGTRRLVIMRAGQPVNGFPVNNIRYPGNSFFGSGSIVPNANSSEPTPNYVVYNGERKEVIVTNLNPTIVYHFAILEFNDFGSSVMYQSGPMLTGTASPAVPLPLVLAFFKVTMQQGKPLLQWATLQEQHTANFYVEARIGNGSFATIAAIPAAGFSNSQRPYSYLHPATQHGIIQYRLRMSDKDGSFTYSKVVQVEISPKEKTWWQLSGNTLMLNLGTMYGSAIHAQLYDGNGRLLKQVATRQPMVQMNLGGLPKGLYHVVWYDNGKQKSIIVHY